MVQVGAIKMRAPCSSLLTLFCVLCRHQTALHKAALQGHLKVCQLLVDAGTSPDIVDSKVKLHYQLLMFAVCLSLTILQSDTEFTIAGIPWD